MQKNENYVQSWSTDAYLENARTVYVKEKETQRLAPKQAMKV